MKCLLTLLVLLAFCGAAQGLSLTFQNPSDFVEFVTSTSTGSGTISWVQSPVGANNYIQVNSGNAADTYLINLDPQSTTYAAATLLSASDNVPNDQHPRLALFGSTGVNLFTYGLDGIPQPSRVEVKIVGGAAQVWINGKLSTTSGALASNPYYVGFGEHSGTLTNPSASWDDYVYGASENKNIFSAPESGYLIKNDLFNPPSSGFSWPNGTVIPTSQFNMTTTYGFGDTNESRIVILQNYGTGQTYGSYTTPTGSMAGTIVWPIYDDVIASGAPQGYYVTTVSGVNKYSQPTPYSSVGGSVAWNEPTYSRGDIAAITYTTDALYWMPATYAYRVDVLDVTLSTVSSHPITTQNGIVTTSFTTSDPLGVYYAVLIATPIAGGGDLWLGIDTTELTGYLTIRGVAVYAPNGTFINGANISINQNAVFDNTTTGVYGNYTTSAAFYSGSITTINATAPGCYQYIYNFTPQEAKTINITISLRLLNATHTGVAIDGVNRDTVYGNPISNLNDVIVNTTYGETYTVSPNPWGYYLLDESDGAYLTSGRVYFIHGNGTAYRQTSDQPYPVVAVGT